MKFIETRAEAVKADMDATPVGGGGGKFTPTVWLSPQVGVKYRLRLLPPWTDEGKNAYLPYKLVGQHWDVGPEKKRVNCGRVMGDGDCYICEQMDALKATGDKSDYARGDAMYPSRRFIYQVIDLDDPVWRGDEEKLGPENADVIGKPKIKFLGLSPTVHRELQTKLAHPDYGRHATDVFAGLELELERVYAPGKKRGKYGRPTVYGLVFGRRETPIFAKPDGTPDTDMIELLGEGLNDMDKHPWLKAATYDEGKMLYTGATSDGDASGGGLSGGTQNGARGALSAPDSSAGPQVDTRLAEWIEQAKGGKPMTREEVAAMGGWDVAQIPPCYGVEPDHEDDGCWGCQVSDACASRYFADKGQHSISEPVSKPVMGKKGASVEGMEAELSAASRR